MAAFDQGFTGDHPSGNSQGKVRADKRNYPAIVKCLMALLDGIDINCPACGRRSRYPLVHAGKTVSCPSCKHEHALPSSGTAAGVQSPTPTAANPPVAAPLAGGKPADADKILFVCASCQYRARIPAQYAGMAVKCPSCDAAQIANADPSSGSTGNTVQLSKLPPPGHKTTIRPGNVLFICSMCNFEAQLAKHYVSKAIRCPGCHAPQVVAGEATNKEPAALEPVAPTSTDAAPTPDPRFICVGCGYRARIPAQYMGLAVTCPKCDTVQIATPEEQEGPATGDTVAIHKIKTAEEGAKIANPQVSAASAQPGVKMPTSKPAPAKTAPTAAAGGGDKVRFTCSACGFKARIPSSYAGENIHCPGCNAVQLVLRSGQMSPNATGNTQVLQVVQTASAGSSPDAIATPTHTPAHGTPTTTGSEVSPAVAKPITSSSSLTPSATALATALATTKVTTPPAVPVAQPAGTAKAESAIDDLLNFQDQPTGGVPTPKSTGKVVRRGNSERLKAAGATKTPLPESVKPSAPATTPVAQPKPTPAVSDLSNVDEEPLSDPSPATVAKTPTKPASTVDRTAQSATDRSEARATISESTPAKSSKALVVLVAIFCFGLLGAVGFLGVQVMDNGKQLVQMTSDLGDVNRKLDETQKQLTEANVKLTEAQNAAKIAKEAADLAAQKQAEEAAARKASEEKAAELEAKLKAAEEAAAKAATEQSTVPEKTPE
jgi:ribosomal protein S27E